MPERQMPKRTAIMLVSLLFVVLYTISIVLLIFLRDRDSELLSGNASQNNSASAVDTSSMPDTSFEQNSGDTSSGNDISDTLSENSMTDNSSSSEQSSDEGNNIDTENNDSNNDKEDNSSSKVEPPAASTPDSSTPTVTPSTVNFSAAIWISVFDMSDMGLEGMTKQKFQSMINEMFDNSVLLGIDTVFCQVRPYGDAFYNSSYFPYSRLLTGTEGKNPGYDPLEIMVSAAHKRGLKIHAWINPYRISTDSTSVSKLADSNPAKKWLTDSDPSNDRYILSHGKGLYYNPAILEVQRLIINGVREICQNYDVDGIHIDDYFYPDGVTNDFDSVEYNASGKKLSLSDWRRANVNALVTGLYSAVKSYGLTFGISPAGNISHNYVDLYADVEKWISTPGYTDYIIPQLYFGYNYPKAEFAYENILSDWMSLKRLSSVEIYIGLSNYKINTKETVGSVTNNEWINEDNVIARQTKDAYDKKADGVVLFSYGSVFGTDKKHIAQTNNFKETLSNIKD